MNKAKEAINKMRKEYQERIGELLTEEYEFNEGSIDTVSALSNAHALEAGVHTLNTLERILNDEEYASKEWGLEATKIEPPIKLIWFYTIGVTGGVYFEEGYTGFYIPPDVVNRIFNDLDAKGFINKSNLPVDEYKIDYDGSILVNSDVGEIIIPSAVFEEMVKEAIIKGNLTISSSINQTLRGSWMNELEIRMKPKTEEKED